MSSVWGEQSPKNIFRQWFPLWKLWETFDLCSMICNLCCPAPRMDVWWVRDPFKCFFFFSFPFHSLPHQRFMTGEKIKEKQMQTLSQESLLDYISALLTNCLIKFTWLSQQIRWEILTIAHQDILKIDDIYWLTLSCSKISYELLCKMKIFKLIIAGEALVWLSI